eukprot:TRINITY_DN8459_c0_g1_i1.p2 TRINITY_DN8459_c0_g1~~TRINITY_DN8459_c0_g1_i1.p2  ORF type:complete len:149 (+),score=30.98 TRINITY_DN8459_c0_g1_i1:47-493(+)
MTKGQTARKGSGNKAAGRKGSKVLGERRTSSTAKSALKHEFSIDCTTPANDGIFDTTILQGFEEYLKERIKINGKTGQLSDKVKVQLDQSKVAVKTYIPFSKRYLKYLTKRYLKKKQLRDWLRVVASDKATYELRYFNIHQDDEEDAE